MKRNEKQNLKSLIKRISSRKEEGITLVALVVTIIILLILAGVAINMALGDNGLFKKSKEAVNTWKSAEENETGVLDYLDREWDNLINGGTQAKPTTPPEEPPKTITGNTVDDVKAKITGNEETPTIITIDGEEIVIPPKFTLAGSDAETPGGQTVSEGIVIVDPQENEWVWVPCYVEGGKGSNIEGRVEYDRYAFTRTNPIWAYRQTKLTEKDADGSYKIVREDDTSYYFHEGLSKESPEYLSIKQYGGYYIGRYEAGDKDLSELETPRLRTSSDETTHKVSIKKNQTPYNYVTKAQCVTLSEEMTSAEGNKETLDGRKVFTKLCSSYSWDTALMFIQKTHLTYGSDSKTNKGTLVDNTTDNGSNSTLAKTGLKGLVCSIYDMGGNLFEYTTESSTLNGSTYVLHGGCYAYDTSGYPAGFCYGYDGLAHDVYGFRPTLFIK